MADFLTWIYIIAAGLLSLYGMLGISTLWLYWRHRGEGDALPSVPLSDLPAVTVQLPIYNERYVVEQLIQAAVQLAYPPERLQIQIVDDSDDETSDIVARLAAYHRVRGVNIEHVRRTHRSGYKAGALAEAMVDATGEYVAIFDADFRPQPDFLLATIPYFHDEPALGMIQARWGHLNAGESALVAAQAIALDKHFVMEQTVRHRANYFPKFNGAAGVWRRQCIEDSGGWLDDTVCEDLCLSTRAVLRGWRFRFLPHVIAPAELPSSISAYKNQQARWAKGSIQCLNKYAWDILRSDKYSLQARLYALLSMSAYATHFLLLILLLLQVPLILMDVKMPALMIVFSLLGLGQPLLFVIAQRETYVAWERRLLYLPTLLLVAVGTAASNARAILEAYTGREHPFVRTPKGAGGGNMGPQDGDGFAYLLPGDKIWLIELGLALYALFGVGVAIATQNLGSLFLLFTSALGFGYVALSGLRETAPSRRRIPRRLLPDSPASRIQQ